MRTWKMPSPIKVGTWTWQCTTMLGVEIAPFSPTLSTPYKVTQESWWKFRDRHHLRWCVCHTEWTLQQCQGPRHFEPGALSTVHGKKRQYQTGGTSVEASPSSCSIIPRATNVDWYDSSIRQGPGPPDAKADCEAKAGKTVWEVRSEWIGILATQAGRFCPISLGWVPWYFLLRA